MTEERKKSTYSPLACGILFCAGVFFLVLSDQFAKYLASVYLKGTKGIVLIPGVLELQYLENRGMAFGMLQGKQALFLIFCLLFFGILILFFWKIPKNRYYLPLIVIEAFLAGGAAGNFIDRLLYGYVVDFIYFACINFPVFNIADIYVVCGGIALAAAVVFRYQDQDFGFFRS